MDTSAPVTEELLIYAGQLACLAASFYMLKIGELKLGALFLLSFALQIQSGYVVSMIEADTESQGACWAIAGSYYECLPLAHRVSIHAAQLGTIVLGLGVFLSARKLGRIRT
tara:strand:+ start:262 stop:597 length:336 start_codon:yes stop_codon:yes gene_type:complete